MLCVMRTFIGRLAAPLVSLLKSEPVVVIGAVAAAAIQLVDAFTAAHVTSWAAAGSVALSLVIRSIVTSPATTAINGKMIGLLAEALHSEMVSSHPNLNVNPPNVITQIVRFLATSADVALNPAVTPAVLPPVNVADPPGPVGPAGLTSMPTTTASALTPVNETATAEVAAPV